MRGLASVFSMLSLTGAAHADAIRTDWNTRPLQSGIATPAGEITAQDILPIAGERPLYGNEPGCPIVVESDRGVLVWADRIENWESTCTMPDGPDLTGAQMVLFCGGEGEGWTSAVTLTVTGDELIYTIDQSEPVTLRRCELFAGIATTARAAEVIPLAPLLFDGMKPEDATLALYDAECSPEESGECVVLNVGCEDSSFEIAVGLPNIELANWLTSNRTGDEIWQGEAALLVGESEIQLYPLTMHYNELNGQWDVEMVAHTNTAATWAAIGAFPNWSVRLHPFEIAFSVNDDARLELRALGQICRTR